jgi:AraC-like DNA-binding protein/mannose-6-phosphate isomerase-like protein (cupin superfamily)
MATMGNMVRLAGHAQLPGLPLASAPCTHGSTLEHAHDCFELVHVQHGSGIHTIEGKPYAILAGDCYLIPTGKGHSYTATDRIKIHNLLFTQNVFSPEDWRRLIAVPGLGPFLDPVEGQRHKLALDPANDHEVATQFRNVHNELQRGSPGSELAARAQFMVLLLMLGRIAAAYLPGDESGGDGPPPGPAAAAAGYIHAHAEEPLTVATVADAVGLSANYLGELFKAEFGLSVHDYVNRLRIERARDLLAGSDRSVTDIAMTVGFDGPSYFGKVFRGATGHTPRAYRRLAQGV